MPNISLMLILEDSMKQLIYLDNAATTQMSEQALMAYSHFSLNKYFNPSSGGEQSLAVKNKIADVRAKIAAFIGASAAKQIVFTSGATESNITAIQSGTKRNGVFVFSAGEHPSVYQKANDLMLQGSKVLFCPLQQNGQLDYEALKQLLTPETAFLSTIYVNNETGAINNLHQIAQIKNQICPKAIWHVDAVQGFGKLDFDVSEIGCDFCSMSSHKIHGAKGLGVLYAKNPERLTKLLIGGEQENNFRAGTENVPAIIALEKVLPSKQQLQANYKYVTNLKQLFVNELNAKLGLQDNVLEGSPYICSVSVPFVQGETLQRLLDSQGIIIGTGSACSSRKVGNRVLEAMGFDKKKVLCTVRISFSGLNTPEEMLNASSAFCRAVKQLQQYGEKA